MPSLEALIRMLEKEPNDAFLLYGVAQEYAKVGDTARAVEYYNRCLGADPGYCYAYYHKARAQANGGEVGAAVATAQAGLVVAKRVQDGHAASELQGLLDELE
jgi:tetratricopeptide (TPR) repeat protein